MKDFSLMAATRAIESAMPFVLYRLTIHLGLTLALLIGTLVGAGTFVAFASFSAKPAAFAGAGAVFGFLGVAYLIHKLRGELLFNVDAGHLTLMGEQAKGTRLPEGKAQIDLARQDAARRFENGVNFYRLRDTLAAALGALPNHYSSFAYRFRNQSFGTWIARLIGLLARGDAEALLVAHCASDAANPWQTARAGLIRAARHFDTVLRYRLQASLFEWVGLAALFALLLYPVDWAVSGLPVDVGYWRYVFAFTFAYSLTASFFQPIATMAMSQMYRQLLSTDLAYSEAELDALRDQSDAIQRILDEAGKGVGA
jgi:hypothetical protein